jgi:integrase
MVGITSADIERYTAKRQADTIIVQHERTIRTRKGTTHLPEIRKPVSNGEINRELALLRRVFTLAIKNGKLLHRPSVELLPEAEPRQGFFDAEQLATVCGHLPTEIAAVVRFAFITGWRITSEVLPLEWSRVDFAGKGSVRLAKGTTKNGEPRRFKMTTQLRALLEAQHAEHARLKAKGRICPLVFHRERLVKQPDGSWKLQAGQPIKSFIKAWRSACIAAGYSGRIPHDLRRSAVRTFVRAGISEHTAMALSGHKTASVFRRYDIVSDGDLDDAAERLDDAISSSRRDAAVTKGA